VCDENPSAIPGKHWERRKAKKKRWFVHELKGNSIIAGKDG